MIDDPDVLANEADLVWLEDLERFDYVREVVIAHHFTEMRPRCPGEGRVIGYTTARRGRREAYDGYGYWRRVFWVAPHDRSEDPHGVYGRGGSPCEGVDPRTVAVGVPGEMTERGWGGPLR